MFVLHKTAKRMESKPKKERKYLKNVFLIKKLHEDYIKNSPNLTVRKLKTQ